MLTSRRIIPAVLLVLLTATIVGLVITDQPIVAPRNRASVWNDPASRMISAAQNQFETAQELAAGAVSRQEQRMAREALRIADNEVDLAFATALQDAAERPAALTPEAQAISDRLKKAQAKLDVGQAEIERLKKLLESAKESSKDALQRQLQLVQAQAELDLDERDDARQDLIRAGGDPIGVVQRRKERYEARKQADSELQNLVPSGTQRSADETELRHAVPLARAWYSLHGRIGQLREAEQEALAQLAALKKSRGSPIAEDTDSVPSSGAAKISSLKQRAAKRTSLEVIDKRIENETQLADTYKRWSMSVRERQRQCVHQLLYCALWILVIALVATLTDLWVSRSLAKLAADRRQMHTLHSVVGYAIRGGGLILILLVIFGPPTQFAAVLALVGAGLTVVMKDFIVAFIGWFVLMGRNGIRAGDWVEIKGVPGEVLEIGPLRTILLETGNWSDAGHPTGRKVAFMNGFAVEGNYFNFSTSGQWMWDEIQFSVPEGADPFAMAEAVKEMVAAETEENAQLATDEWRKVAPVAAPQAFRAEPVMSVRPTGSGVTLVVRYITRATERHEVRSRIYRAMIDLQRRDTPELEPRTIRPSN